MGEQGLDDFFFARVKAKKLLHIETGIHRDDPQQSRSFISIDFSLVFMGITSNGVI